MNVIQILVDQRHFFKKKFFFKCTIKKCFHEVRHFSFITGAKDCYWYFITGAHTDFFKDVFYTQQKKKNVRYGVIPSFKKFSNRNNYFASEREKKSKEKSNN